MNGIKSRAAFAALPPSSDFGETSRRAKADLHLPRGIKPDQPDYRLPV
jgi:hypothetical protein